MFAIITYKYVGGGSSGEPVTRVRFSDTVVFDVETRYGVNPVSGEIRETYLRFGENDSTVLTKLLNDPTKARVILGSGWRYPATAVNVENCGSLDTARKLVDPVPTVRPALFRAGNASLFKNL